MTSYTSIARIKRCENTIQRLAARVIRQLHWKVPSDVPTGFLFAQQRVLNAKRLARISLAVIAMLFLSADLAHATLIHESATVGSTGHNLPGVNATSQFLGSRFTLSSSTTVTHVGGHLADHSTDPNPTPSTMWGAIVALDPSPTALPTFGNQQVSNHALASVVFTPGALSADLNVALTTPVVLGPGQYGLIFGGAGDFGTTGNGSMPTDTQTGATNLPGASYFFRSSAKTWHNGGFDRVRFTVSGVVVPEPTAIALVTISSIGLISPRRKRKQG